MHFRLHFKDTKLGCEYSLIKCKQDRNMKFKVVTHPRESSINNSLQTKLYSLLSVHSITAHFLVIYLQVENEVLRKLHYLFSL